MAVNYDDAILGEGEVGVTLPAVFIIGLIRVLLVIKLITRALVGVGI